MEHRKRGEKSLLELHHSKTIRRESFIICMAFREERPEKKNKTIYLNLPPMKFHLFLFIVAKRMQKKTVHVINFINCLSHSILTLELNVIE